MEQIINEILQTPAKGFAIASTLGLISLITYGLKRVDDGKKIRWPTTSVIVVLALTSVGSWFLYLHKPIAEKSASHASDATESDNEPPGTPKRFCDRLVYLEENAGRYIGNFRGPKITDPGERAKYVSRVGGVEVDLYPATIKVFGDADYCLIDEAPSLPGPQGLSNYRCSFASKNPLQLAVRVKAQLLTCFPLSVVEEHPAQNLFKVNFNTSKDVAGPGYFELFYGGNGLTFSILPTCAIPYYCPSLLAPRGRRVSPVY